MRKNEISKIFNSWNNLKIELHLNSNIKFAEERQIWWASLGKNIGVEINGKNDRFERPVLIIKKYNKDSFLIVPISSKEKKSIYHYFFNDDRGRKNILNFSQIKVISRKRLIRKMGKIDLLIFKNIKENLIELFK